ncbi:unnamed protein product [Dovyalis caffra]|uniref:SMODS and SLOG-associating 2TM effector domain-containing protein n=1 Tax=Dovyalis caffra TaxID=77055 RepID=A0AAV1SLL8_9ROSI|nr:unnamed protein product [Dovyalis caffra]
MENEGRKSLIPQNMANLGFELKSLRLCLNWYGIKRFLFLDKLDGESERIQQGYTEQLREFAQVFQEESDVGTILKEHLRIRRNLRIISHRFRKFILFSLVGVTASQFISLLTTTRSSASNNIFEAAELLLCSINLVTGLFICLRSATKITHRAQSITSLAAKWHICATINSYDDMDGDTPTTQIAPSRGFPVNIDWVLDDEEEDGDDDLDNAKMVPIFAHTISFQKRQALG